MVGTTTKVREKVRSRERGKVFFIDNFADLDSPGAVRLALMELTNEGFIHRVARGIYCYPRFVGDYGLRTATPSPEFIAYALATKERVRIIPYGDIAAKKLCLTGIVISEHKYLTDGAPRKINLEKGKKVMFFHTSEVKMFDFCNETMQMISSAIRALGEELIDDDRRRILREHLRSIPDKDFNRDITIPPAWVGKLMTEIRDE